MPYRVETNHPWPDNTVLGGFFLVLTNLVLFFAVFYLLSVGHFDTAAVLTSMMFISSAYHACRAGFVCFGRFRTQQTMDHVFVNLTLSWIACKCIVRKEWFSAAVRRTYPELVFRTRVAIFFLFIAPILGVVIDNPENKWVLGYSIISAAILVALSATITRTPVFGRPWYGWSGCAVFVVGASFYCVFPADWYDVSHTLWHVFSMIAIPLLSIGCDPPRRRVALSPASSDSKSKDPKVGKVNV